MSRPLPGFAPLLRNAAEQSRLLIAPWIALITALAVSSLVAYPWIFPHDDQRRALAASISSNPAFSLIFGPAHNLLTADGFTAWRSFALGSFFAGLMAIFIVVRETRTKEDSGQAELVGSNVVGRYTQLAVGVALAWICSLILGVVSATTLILCGGDHTSSLILAAGFTASGMLFAAVAAITCQIGSYAGAATSLAVSTLGIAYLVRAYASTSPDADWAVWATPLGWIIKAEPSGSNNPWPLILTAATAVILAAVAGLLAAHRDFSAGLLPSRPGRTRAGAVASITGLTLRLHRSSIITWTLSFALIGAMFGTLVSSLGDVFTKNAQIGQIIGAGAHIDLTFAFIRTLLEILGIIAAVYGVGIMMRYFKEESENRVDPLLAGAVSRPKLYAAHVFVALLGPAAAIVLAAVVITLITHANGLNTSATDILRQAFIEIPAVWVLIGLSVAIIGARPIARLAAWMAIVITFALTILGPIFNLWEWILAISPLWHVPNVAAASPEWVQLLWLSLVVLVFLAVGVKGYSHRDIGRV